MPTLCAPEKGVEGEEDSVAHPFQKELFRERLALRFFSLFFGRGGKISEDRHCLVGLRKKGSHISQGLSMAEAGTPQSARSDAVFISLSCGTSFRGFLSIRKIIWTSWILKKWAMPKYTIIPRPT